MSKIKSFISWRNRCSATQTTLYIQYNKDHAYTHVRTQKGQRSQNVSTALSVAFITLQLYIMKNEHRFIFGHSHLHNMQFRQQNYYKFLTCARKFKKKIIFKAILHFFL